MLSILCSKYVLNLTIFTAPPTLATLVQDHHCYCLNCHCSPAGSLFPLLLLAVFLSPLFRTSLWLPVTFRTECTVLRLTRLHISGSQCGTQASSISVTWELGRNAHFQVPAIEAETLGVASSLCFHTPFAWV